MAIRYPGIDVVKTAKRTAFIDGLVEILSAPGIYKGLPYTISEETFVHKVQIPLLNGIAELLSTEHPGRTEQWYKAEADRILNCEKDTTVTITNTVFFGTQHRPDMIISREPLYRIAFEYKVVTTGETLRAALGQCLTYSSDYEFTICVIIDMTKDGKIRRAFLQEGKEQRLIKELWDGFGVRLVVVQPNMK